MDLLKTGCKDSSLSDCFMISTEDAPRRIHVGRDLSAQRFSTIKLCVASDATDKLNRERASIQLVGPIQNGNFQSPLTTIKKVGLVPI